MNEKKMKIKNLISQKHLKMFLKNNILGLNFSNKLSEVSDPIIDSLNKTLKNKKFNILDKIIIKKSLVLKF